MACIIYARVSTPGQAEKELSIPAQFRLSKRWADDHKVVYLENFQDIATGKTFRGRSGLMAAIQRATKDPQVDMILVHRIDRIARNIIHYLTIKNQLRQHGVRIVSVVENFDSSPMGEFLENIMAAQAEFYSANLSLEVKKGLEERLQKGLWNGVPPIGYRKVNGRLVLDPARAPHVRYAFERWAEGTVTSRVLANELEERGLVGKQGKPIRASKLCDILKNPFYVGWMVVAGNEYRGVHPPLITREVFDRAQVVFQQKSGGKRQTRQHLEFILARKVVCPNCTSFLTGEQHTKPSGTVYRYYRCHEKGCSFSIRAEGLEDQVCNELLAMNLPGRVIPRLRKQLQVERQKQARVQTERVRGFREERKRLEGMLEELMKAHGRGEVGATDYVREHTEIQTNIRATAWLLSPTARRELGVRNTQGVRPLLKTIEALEWWLKSRDPVERRRAVETVVQTVLPHQDTFVIELRQLDTIPALPTKTEQTQESKKLVLEVSRPRTTKVRSSGAVCSAFEESGY